MVRGGLAYREIVDFSDGPVFIRAIKLIIYSSRCLLLTLGPGNLILLTELPPPPTKKKEIKILIYLKNIY
jgi:hypothetical protein